eukprot:133660-Amphidinium_carterae.1
MHLTILLKSSGAAFHCTSVGESELASGMFSDHQLRSATAVVICSIDMLNKYSLPAAMDVLTSLSVSPA